MVNPENQSKSNLTQHRIPESGPWQNFVCFQYQQEGRLIGFRKQYNARVINVLNLPKLCLFQYQQGLKHCLGCREQDNVTQVNLIVFNMKVSV